MKDDEKPALPPPNWEKHIERDIEWGLRPACTPDERKAYAKRILDMVARVKLYMILDPNA